MINEEKMKELRNKDPQKTALLVARKYGEKVDGYFDIFKTINDLDIRITLANYGIKENGEPLECCQFVPRNNHERGYIVLSNCLSIQRLRFNSAIMLYCAINNTKIETYKRGSSEKSFRQAKIFAVNLLMPEKDLKEYVFQKDKNGKYLFLNEKGEISLDNINYIAAHFGTPYKTTASRILNVINNIEGIKTREELNVAIENRKYVKVMDQKSKKEVSAMYAQLINSLRYLKVGKTKAITLEKILRECVKNEALLEGVIKNTKGVNNLLQIFAKDGYIDEYGFLHGKYLDKPIRLSEDQLIVLGNYELLKNIAYEGAAYYTNDNTELVEQSINNAGYGLSKKEIKEELKEIGLKYLSDQITYKQMENFLSSTIGMNASEIEKFSKELIGFDHYTISRFHKTLFKYSIEQAHIKGQYRLTKNIVPGANFDTAEVHEIQYAMEDLNYDIIDLLKQKDELSYTEYINKVNELVARFIRIHPFEDGNGRVSRAITNFLYKKKNLPFIFINADNQREAYISALKQIDFYDIKYKKLDVDLTDINLVMYKAIQTSYSNIHEGNKMITNPEKEIARNRLIRGRK